MRRVVHAVACDPVRVHRLAVEGDLRCPGRRGEPGEPSRQGAGFVGDAGQDEVDVDDARRPDRTAARAADPGPSPDGSARCPAGSACRTGPRAHGRRTRRSTTCRRSVACSAGRSRALRRPHANDRAAPRARSPRRCRSTARRRSRTACTSRSAPPHARSAASASRCCRQPARASGLVRVRGARSANATVSPTTHVPPRIQPPKTSVAQCTPR